ncbi:MAG: TatD family hydrolase [Eubacteriales bacterium]
MTSSKYTGIFDSHAHYDDDRYDPDREEVLQKVFGGGVSHVINIGSSLENSYDSVSLAERYPTIYASVGVHPHEAGTTPEDTLERLRGLLRHPKVVAVGEIGLDYYYDNTVRPVQREWFKKQMELARDTGYPVVIHDRDAHAEVYDILKSFPEVRGVVHCYSGSAEMARELLKLGYYIAFGGVVTFKNAKKSHEALMEVPLERLLIETDAPYLAPTPHRGERNDSSLLPYIVDAIAGVKGVSGDEIVWRTAQNTSELFGIKL